MMPQRSILVMVILSLVTCGIYNLIWIYMARQEFREYTGNETINPGVELLFSILCFPYLLYWCYRFSRDIAAVQQQEGKSEDDLALLTVLLTLFGFFMVSELILQAKLNDLPQK